MTQTLIQSVTSNAIPLDRAQECYRRIGPTRRQRMNDLKTAFERFVEAEEELRFMQATPSF